MSEASGLQVGDTGVLAQISPCVGGLVRTWVDGGKSTLWSTPDAVWLLHTQATGRIGRTPREDHRFREAGMFFESSDTLIVQSRFPVKVEDDSLQIEAHTVRLEPAGSPNEALLDEFRALLARAIHYCLGNNELLVVEKGGWDAPDEPFCLFIVMAEGDHFVSVIETAPAPIGSELWDPHIVPGRESQNLRAPANPHTIDVAPFLMIEAINRWGLQLWDLALTFGQR
jgi:hypothetical protein